MAGPILTLLAAGLKAAGSVMRGFDESRAGRIQASILRQNADLTMTNARLRSSAVRRDGAFAATGIIARSSANNLDPTVGSPLLAVGFSISEAELDAQLIGMDARNQASIMRLQASELDRAAQRSILAGIFGAGTALLQGVSDAGFGGGGTPPTVAPAGDG